MKKLIFFKRCLFLYFLLVISINLESAIAQNLTSDKAVADQAEQLNKENISLHSTLMKLITDKALLKQERPFPKELRIKTDGLIEEFLSHGDVLLEYAKNLSEKYNDARCIDMLKSIAKPAIQEVKEEYAQTRQSTPHSSEKDLQLANLWGYQILTSSSFMKIHQVRETLFICSHPNLPGS